jgi:hypothetical protein
MSDDQGVESFATGLSNSISSYLGGQISAQNTMAAKQQEANIDENKQVNVAKRTADLTKGQPAYLQRDLAEKALPGYGGKIVDDYNQQNPNNPLTMDQGMNYIKNAHDLLNPDTSKVDQKASDTQDKLEKQYSDRLAKVVAFRSGGLGLQDQKVNQAIDLRTLVNQYYDPKTGDYNVPPAQHSELALGLAKLLSPQGTVPIELEKQLRQSTGREALANALIYAGADPASVGGPTQSVIKMFVDSIDRQGSTAERLRGKYIDGLKDLRPTSLNQDRVDRLNKAELTNSFSDTLSSSPDHQKTDPAHTGRVPVIDKSGKKYTIPANQVEQALKAGYTQG